jgi:hypothetical protein
MEIVIGVLIGLLCLALIAIVPILQQREANKIKKSARRTKTPRIAFRYRLSEAYGYTLS